jgi:hypothetical protein
MVPVGVFGQPVHIDSINIPVVIETKTVRDDDLPEKRAAEKRAVPKNVPGQFSACVF